MPTRSTVQSYLEEIGPYEFENLIAEIWEFKFGYTTRTTSASQDRGVDIVAIQNEPLNEKILIQTKLYQKGNKVGSQQIREYATLYQQDNDADQVVLISTGGFTKQADELADDLRVTIFDKKDVINWLTSDDVASKLTHQIEETQNNNQVSDFPTDPDTTNPNDSIPDSSEINEWTISDFLEKSTVHESGIAIIDENITVESLYNTLRIHVQLVDHEYGKNNNTSVIFAFEDYSETWLPDEGICYSEGMYQIPSSSDGIISKSDKVMENKEDITDGFVDTYEHITTASYFYEDISKKIDLEEDFRTIIDLMRDGFDKFVDDLEYIQLESNRISENGDSSLKSCENCDRILQDRQSYQEHLHEKHDYIICQHCGKALKDKQTVQNHLRREHNYKGNYGQCPHCDDNFRSENELQTHLYENHGYRECPECGDIFEDKSSIETHLRKEHW